MRQQRLVDCYLPHPQDEVQVEQDKERIVRMANILGFAVVSAVCGAV